MERFLIKPVCIVAIVILGFLGGSSCSDQKKDTPQPTQPQPEPEPPKDLTLKITSISSATVHYGDTVTVNGNNFSTTASEDKVTINDVAATVISATASALKIVVPVLTRSSNELKLQVGTSTVSGGTITYQPTVFVAGSLNNSATSLATYWKNGKAVNISQNESGLNAISVNASGIYVAGWERVNNLQLANYWKNGVKTTLGTGASAVYAMAVNGTDVYTGGFEIINGFDVPRYWQNTTGTTVQAFDPIVSHDVLGNGACGGLYFANNNAYAVGNYRNSQGRFSPWETKNGVVPANTVPNNDKHSFANAVFVNGTDEYIAGTQNSPVTGLAMATVWKNGEPTLLTDGTNSVGIARAIVVVGGDVYVAGYEQENYFGGGGTYAKYWKNGTAVKLSTVSSNAIGIAIFDNDVYVVGWENNGTRDVAKYWKNGTAVSLTDGAFVSVGNAIVLR